VATSTRNESAAWATSWAMSQQDPPPTETAPAHHRGLLSLVMPNLFANPRGLSGCQRYERHIGLTRSALEWAIRPPRSRIKEAPLHGLTCSVGRRWSRLRLRQRMPYGGLLLSLGGADCHERGHDDADCDPAHQCLSSSEARFERPHNPPPSDLTRYRAALRFG